MKCEVCEVMSSHHLPEADGAGGHRLVALAYGLKVPYERVVAFSQSCMWLSWHERRGLILYHLTRRSLYTTFIW